MELILWGIFSVVFKYVIFNGYNLCYNSKRKSKSSSNVASTAKDSQLFQPLPQWWFCNISENKSCRRLNNTGKQFHERYLWLSPTITSKRHNLQTTNFKNMHNTLSNSLMFTMELIRNMNIQKCYKNENQNPRDTTFSDGDWQRERETRRLS